MLCGMVWLNLYNGNMETSNEQVINMNKLVAEFMGAVVDINNTSQMKILVFPKGSLPDYTKNKWPEIGMLFHSDLDWQVPVLNKIMEIAKEKRWIGFSITTATSFVRHNMKDIVNYVCSMGGALDQKYFSLSSKSSMAEATFGCICKFIEWYNGINKV